MKQLMNWTSALVLATSLVLANAGPGLTKAPTEAEKSATKSTKKAKAKASSKTKAKPSAKPKAKSQLGKVQEGDDSYKVAKGDTVYAIAERLHMTPDTLIKMNALKKPYTLKVGRTLKVPAAKVYVIKPGDSLYAISKRFSVDVDSLTALNKTGAKATIKPGQKLELPAEARDLVAEAEAAAEKQLAADAARIAKKKEAARAKGRRAPEAMPAPATEPKLDLGILGIKKPEPAVEPTPQPTEIATAPAPTSRPIFSVPSFGGYSTGTPSAVTTNMPAAAGPILSVLDPPPAPPTEAEIIASGRGRFIWPVRGDIISGFGPKDTGQRNDGINISGKEGDIVKSAASGDVVYSGNLVPGFGNLVLIKHEGGWVTAYAHLSKTLVKIKDKIAQGQDIGAVGKTGGVETAQLHFELRYAPSPKEKARPVDPALVMPR
jgi:murein DD-endopeptidase MepM/ murein hydrolase activator NlpD